MSIEKVGKAVEEFLSNNSPEVLSIKGSWGVGKTYFWSECIKNANSNNKLEIDKYAYVSLFGITTLDELKFTIFEQIVNKSQIGEQVSIDNLKKNWDDLGKSLGRRLIPFLLGLPGLKNYGSAIQSASFFSVRDVLICLDDFERKGDALSSKDILGLVSLLREQRNCKIVLIFNDTYLTGESLDGYKQFREKVIDIEIEYAPSIEEATKLVFIGEEKHIRKLRESATKLKITNIRILNKIKKLVDISLPVLEGFEDEIVDQVCHTLTIGTWCYFSNTDNVPQYDYVKNIGHSFFGLDEKNEKPEEETRWDNILSMYGFRYTDEFDVVLFNYIEAGYIEVESFLKAATSQNETILANKSQNSFSAAWDLYHNSFNDNKNELVGGLVEALNEHGRYVSPVNMNAAVRLLKKLGKEELAREMISTYIELNRDRKELFNLDEIAFSGDIDDTDVRSSFNKIYNESKDVKTIDDVLENLVGKNGWGLSDEEVLAAATPDQYYDFFKKQDTDKLREYVKICLRFGQFQNPKDKYTQIANNSKEALIRIGKENKLNEVRVRSFGISIEEGD